MATVVEIAAMRRAIALAALGLGTTSPNPPVGCVILGRDGRVVGEGFHERKGEAHAEAHALAMAGEYARGGIALVTLEPCNHHGRTPPCRQALLDAGIARCVIALLDPTSRKGGGAARLRTAGVDVEVGVLADEVELVLGPWLHALRTGRPFVTWASVAEVDGDRIPLPEPLLTVQEAAVDVVLADNGQLAEGIPGGHGPGMVELGGIDGNAAPHELLATLHEAGARSVLLDCGRERATPFVDANLIDEVSVYVPIHKADESMFGQEPNALLPTGFRIRTVSKNGPFVQVAASQT
jgi:diaminohydroxyphosphoribosylaminopyrimidine deaminase/5-amino-6-(5-phosphoribosylamino)uracil reductase